MAWKVIKRKIGRAGGLRQRQARQREWDRKYGEGLWDIGYVIDAALPRMASLCLKMRRWKRSIIAA